MKIIDNRRNVNEIQGKHNSGRLCKFVTIILIPAEILILTSELNIIVVKRGKMHVPRTRIYFVKDHAKPITTIM